jgi:hypothetical protein
MEAVLHTTVQRLEKCTHNNEKKRKANGLTLFLYAFREVVMFTPKIPPIMATSI